MKMYLVSACLVGKNCRYDGGSSLSVNIAKVNAFLKNKVFVAICPEELGGLPTPRPPSSFLWGTGIDVINGNAQLIDSNGNDLTKQFVIGAKECLKIAETRGITDAILKERSPSCGVREVYLDGQIVNGMGVTTALLKENNIVVMSNEEL
jgi:uncharacterized protein YbbK (DUF523 family)